VSPADRSKFSFLGRIGAAGAISLLVAACVNAGSGGSPTPSPRESEPVPAGSSALSPAPSVVPGDLALASGFYLRAYRTQAIAPQYTFGWLPAATISGGLFIDGNVAVPAIYPGPLYVAPVARPITARGIAAIIGEARKDGLLGAAKEFGDAATPGSMRCHIALTIGGTTSDLYGPCPNGLVSGVPAPGSGDAYMSFWNKVTSLDFWIPTELGASEVFAPERMGILIAPPVEASSGITPQETAWPLSSTFATFGIPTGTNVRCATVIGTDLARLLPVVQASNQPTRFVDSTGARMSLQVRPLVPGEPALCQP
jgi:hypothetical protein